MPATAILTFLKGIMYTISEMSKKCSVAVLTIVLYRFQTDEPVSVSLVGEIIEFFLKVNRKKRELFNLHALLLYQMGNMKIISQKDQGKGTLEEFRYFLFPFTVSIDSITLIGKNDCLERVLEKFHFTLQNAFLPYGRFHLTIFLF